LEADVVDKFSGEAEVFWGKSPSIGGATDPKLAAAAVALVAGDWSSTIGA